VIADAIVKNVPNFDLSLARDALMKDAFEQPPAVSGGAAGKDGLDVYEKFGFIPEDTPRSGESVSRTLGNKNNIHI
jgi:putative alpha-1,2-mannosidase